MFGLVLAIGLVVDDAIVVVEGVQRHIEEGLAPKDAARKAMEELSGPVVGIALVLSAVFVPTVFIPGITGRLYQQFAMTIAISVVLSAFNALTLSPALAALLLRPKKEEAAGRWQDSSGGSIACSGAATDSYVRLSGGTDSQGRCWRWCCWRLAAWPGSSLAGRLPSSFLPDEDQGYVYRQHATSECIFAGADGCGRERRGEDPERIRPGLSTPRSVVGFSLLSFIRTSYNAFFFVTLKPWSDRESQSENSIRPSRSA